MQCAKCGIEYRCVFCPQCQRPDCEATFSEEIEIPLQCNISHPFTEQELLLWNKSVDMWEQFLKLPTIERRPRQEKFRNSINDMQDIIIAIAFKRAYPDMKVDSQ